MKALKFIGIAIAILFGLLLIMPSAKPTLDSMEVSKATFEEVQLNTGCTSPFSDDKKEAMFKDGYKGKVFEWEGIVGRSKDGMIDINLNDGIAPDLTVELSDKKRGFDLLEDQPIKVKFVMDTAGGCFLPYQGKLAVVL